MWSVVVRLYILSQSTEVILSNIKKPLSLGSIKHLEDDVASGTTETTILRFQLKTSL